MRKIIVSGQNWQWKVGKQYVMIRGPSKEKIVIRCSDICGVTPYEYERAKYKRCAYSITPSMIEETIRARID